MCGAHVNRSVRSSGREKTKDGGMEGTEGGKGGSRQEGRRKGKNGPEREMESGGNGKE